MIFYIADLHLNDQKIFDKCQRPFKNLKEYKDTLFANWNNKVAKKDTVFVLGDIADDNDVSWIAEFKKLNGTKHLIIGNHDNLILNQIIKSKIFESVDFIKMVMDNNRKVCVCHYPLMDWLEFNRNGLFVYGHVHNKTEKNGKAYAQIKEYYKDKPAYNCGVDVTNFKPVTLDEMINLKEELKNGPYIN